MKAEDIKINLKELREFKKRNFKDRLDFIKFWIDYMKKHSDKEWSKQQAVLIDSQIQNSRNLLKKKSNRMGFIKNRKNGANNKQDL
ncbi:hypothetical protein HYT25_01385 [Candidatus Pacearchaeota archaeon]|nr:hypothetical protein [Candidatus Pacearchaeota archaeon]